MYLANFLLQEVEGVPFAYISGRGAVCFVTIIMAGVLIQSLHA